MASYGSYYLIIDQEVNKWWAVFCEIKESILHQKVTAIGRVDAWLLGQDRQANLLKFKYQGSRKELIGSL